MPAYWSAEDRKDIVRQFYHAFAEHDAEAMVALYSTNVIFKDPAFGQLSGQDACDMWRMLISRGGDNLSIELVSLDIKGDAVEAVWRATYPFGPKNNKVINTVTGHFEFTSQEISHHTDTFDLWKWSRQALGLSGILLGWTSFFKRKLQAQTTQRLLNYQSKMRPSQSDQ